mmetsp:Transcript_21534/g.50165  ORF Transcript_21534/g.50165 Transcript_21534/m.50165 type:complete len:632 (+) Transcript_21534:46-1941(+)
MKVLITGGAGFLGQELAKLLLAPEAPGLSYRVQAGDQCSPELVGEVLLFDVPGAFDALAEGPVCSDPRVRCITGSINDLDVMKSLIDKPEMSVFHLAGIMSGQGEKDFDLCLRVNLDGTRTVLEACRAAAVPGRRLVRVVFASSGATYGETNECPVQDETKQVPLNTYGVTKAMSEMLVNDYTRKGFLDGRSARLPTVIVRPGKPNAATTSCFSGVVREPLKGMDVALPVDRHLPHAVSSTRALVANLRALHDAGLGRPSEGLVDRAVSLPSISITLQALVDALLRVVPAEQHPKLGRITDAIDPFLSSVVSNMAIKEMGQDRALNFGLARVPDVDTIVREYLEDFGSDSVVEAPWGGWTSEAPSTKRLRAAAPLQRVAVVTGAGAGIGRASAVALARAGFRRLAIVGRRKEALEETASLARGAISEQLEVLTVSCDVTRPADVLRLFREVEHHFDRCDVLFNNAGVCASPTPVEELAFSAWQRCVGTNLTGSFLCAQEAFKLMKRQSPRGGRIINNGSVSADRPRPLSAAYTASKHAVTGLTKCLALDGRAFDIACGQIDVGNAVTAMSKSISTGTLQATVDGSERRLAEPMMDVENVAQSVVHMASLPLDANVLFMTVMATKMPLVGRG